MVYSLHLYDWERGTNYWSFTLFTLRCQYKFHHLFRVERIGEEHCLEIGPFRFWL